MEKAEYHFEVFPPKPFYHILPAIFFIPLLIASISFVVFVVIPAKIEANLMDSANWLFFGVSTIGALYGLYSFFIYLILFWKVSYSVDLYETNYIGYNLWKDPWEMQYEKIKSINRYKKYNTIIITSFDNQQIKISAGLDEIGKCINLIKERAINVEEVDYGGLDKYPGIWEKKMSVIQYEEKMKRRKK